MSLARSIQTVIMPPAKFQHGQECLILVAPLLDCGFYVCGHSYLVMQFDRVYDRRLLVMLAVRALYAPLLARQRSMYFVIMC